MTTIRHIYFSSWALMVHGYHEREGLVVRRRNNSPRLCTAIISGCTEPKNQTQVIYTGNPSPDLMTDMEYRTIDLPLRNNSEIPEGLEISNLSVGTLKDGKPALPGNDTNTRTDSGPWLCIRIHRAAWNDSAAVATSPPLVSKRNLPAGGSFQYFM